MRRLVIVCMLFQFSLLAHAERPVALITGATNGVGLETAKLLSNAGFRVYGTTRQIPEDLPPLEEEVLFIQVDLRSEKSVQQAVDDILQKEGRIDLLINNAGYVLVGPAESYTEQEIYDQMDINFFAPIRCIKAVLPTMRKQRSGHIINVSSVNAHNTPPYGGLYAASKAALESFSEALYVELRPFYILVTIVEPGLLNTGLTLTLGTKMIEENPYRETINALLQYCSERMAHPEKLSGQPPEEVAALLVSIAQDPNPHLRYQTSQEAVEDVSWRLQDLTGYIYLQKIFGWTE